jgi:hypothetical protein
MHAARRVHPTVVPLKHPNALMRLNPKTHDDFKYRTFPKPLRLQACRCGGDYPQRQLNIAKATLCFNHTDYLRLFRYDTTQIILGFDFVARIRRSLIPSHCGLFYQRDTGNLHPSLESVPNEFSYSQSFDHLLSVTYI